MRRGSFLAWFLPIVLGILALFVAGYAGYSNNDKALAERITAVEVNETHSQADIKEIKVTVQKIYDKIANW